jgi:uncharacterized protein YdiU (UPF0061 family)
LPPGRTHGALKRLAEYALARHYPDTPRTEGAAMALLDSVMGAQASLVAKWLALGFVHGVMNTDNTVHQRRDPRLRALRLPRHVQPRPRV